MGKNSSACPHCGSTSVEFRRERTSANSASAGTSVKLSKRVRTGGGKRKTKYSYANRGFCKDCGYSWDADWQNGKRPAWFWLLAIIFFPISLSVLFWKSEKINLKKPVKGGILAVVWIILFAVYGSDAETSPADPATTSIVQEVDNSTEQSLDQMIDEQVNVVASVETPQTVEDTTPVEVVDEKKEEAKTPVEGNTSVTSGGTTVNIEETEEKKEESKIETTTSVEEPEKPEFTYTDINETRYADIDMNVRSLPNLSGDVVGILAQNDEVKVTGKCNETGWYRIEYKGAEAFASNDHLKTEKVVVQAPVVVTPPTDQPTETPTAETTYVLNTSSKKFHKPTCPSVKDIKASNRKDVTESRDEVIAKGYVACKRCYP